MSDHVLQMQAKIDALAAENAELRSLLGDVENILSRKCYACDDGDQYEDCTCYLVGTAKEDALAKIRAAKEKA